MKHLTRVTCPLLVCAVLVALTACGVSSAENTASSGTGGIQLDQQIHDRLPAPIKQRGTLRFATDPSYAPMESYAPDGRTIVGFEPDLAAALGTVLGVRVEMAAADFGAALEDTSNGTYDGVLSAMTDTTERQRQADFLNYFSAGTSIVVQRGNPHGVTDLDDLCGRAVAVEKATVQVDLLQRAQSGCGERPIAVRKYKTNADALLQLRTGRAAAVLNDYPPAAHLATDPKTRARYQLASTVQYEPGLYGLAVAKGSDELLDALQAALDRLMRSGAYADLLQRWGLTTGGIASSSINAGG
jgi:polar amino acid transport system substrate-binding protein